MRNFKLAFITLLCLTMTFFTSCTQQEKDSEVENSNRIQNEQVKNKDALKDKDKKLKTYINKVYNFSVDYPEDWKIKEDEEYISSETHEGSTELGITIYVENKEDDEIYICRHFRPFEIEGTTLKKEELASEEFITTQGKKGSIYYKDFQDDNKHLIILVLDGGDYTAQVDISKDSLNKNKGQIMKILKSMKILE